MLRSCLRAVVSGAVLTSAVAAPARAQEGRLIAEDGLTCVEHVACNEMLPCAHPGDFCEEEVNVCASIATTDTQCCLLAAGCERTGGTCMAVTASWGYCVGGPPPPTTCPDGPLASCFQRTSWDDGNCDGDELLNKDELPGCVCDADENCGDGADGGGVDGGPVRTRDGGASTTDAGNEEMKRDAGDTGRLAVDSWDYRGSGGCTCDASSTGADAAWLAVGLAVALGARRRKRTRQCARI